MGTDYGRRRPDVVVVGAGPTGLLLAGDLAEAGLSVHLLEKRQEESNLTRAFAVHARTLEQLDARGLADDLVTTGNTVEGLRLFGSVSVRLSSLPSRFPFLLVTAQYHVERLLWDRAVAAGVHIERGARVTEVAQDQATDTPVRTTYVAADGSTRMLTSPYLVGTDGHHSTVRQQLDLDFPGESVIRSLMLADVRLSEPPSELLTVEGNQHGFCFVVPYGDGWFRIIARDPRRELPDDAPVSLDEISDLARRVLGTDFGMHDPRWMSRFHSDERQVRQYRVGRVFLAGDAAHVHSPAGGMGMNTGLQDAANLGWKLAAVLQHRAGPELLDTYQAERLPVGAMVLRTSGGLIRAAMLRAPIARAIRNIVARTALALPPVGDRLRMRLSGIGVAYPGAGGAHSAVGSRAADQHGQDGQRLYEALRGGRFVLVAPHAVARRYAGNDRLATLSPEEPSEPRLVRPDGYVAWAGPTSSGLDAALRAWGALDDISV